MAANVRINQNIPKTRLEKTLIVLCFTHYRQYSSNVTAERTFNGSRQNQNTRIRKTYFLQFLGLVTTWDTFWVPYKGKSQIPYRAWISRNKLKSKLRLNSEYLIFFPQILENSNIWISRKTLPLFSSSTKKKVTCIVDLR